MSAKRALYWESSDNIKPIIDHLQKENILTPTVWVSKNPNCTIDVHNFDYARYDDYIYKPIPKELVEKLEKYKYTYFEMFQRNYRPWEQNAYNGKTMHEMNNIFYMTINKLYSIFTENKIEFVFLARIPHLGADYIMYRMAELLNIPRISFQVNSLMDDKNYSNYVVNLDDFGYFKKNPVDENILKSEFDFSYINNILEKYQSNQQSFFAKNQNAQLGIFKKFLEEFKDKNTRELSIIRYNRKRDYAKKIDEIANNSPDLNIDYVYFPLHLQPEMTTSLLGGKYCDQILAIEDLTRILPKDWKIYVKENPLQSFFQRDNYFFKRLLAIPNVVFVGKNVSSVELIKKAKLVSTITGTAGWEAILLGKPVIVFGQAWYLNFSGVYQYNENLDTNNIINTQIKLDDIFEQVKIYRAKMAPFNINIYTDINSLQAEKNLGKCAQFMKKYIANFE